MKDLLKGLKETFKGNVWAPDFITVIDSDPRYRALDVIERRTKTLIDWDWKNTDFSNIKGEPVIVEFSNTNNDAIKYKEGLKLIQKACKDKFTIIKDYNLVIILNK